MEKLNYPIITRSPSVSQLLNFPRDTRKNVYVRILKYIKRAPNKGFVFISRGHSNIVGYSDVIWI